MIKFNLSMAEFGNSLSTGLLLPHIYALNHPNEHVVVEHKFDFPKELTNIWPFEYIQKKDRSDKSKGQIEAICLSKLDRIESVPLIELENIMSGKYVVLIVVITEWFDKKPDYRYRNSFSFVNWVKIADMIRSLGVKVYAIGGWDGSTPSQLKRIGDEYMHVNNYKDYAYHSKCFWKQLGLMQNAMFSFAVGGAGHTGITFDTLNGFFFDGQFYTNYKKIAPTLIKNRKGFYRIPNPKCYGSDPIFINGWAEFNYWMIHDRILKELS